MDVFVSKQNNNEDLHMITSIQNIYLFEWMVLLKWRMVELATMTNNKMKKAKDKNTMEFTTLMNTRM